MLLGAGGLLGYGIMDLVSFLDRNQLNSDGLQPNLVETRFSFRHFGIAFKSEMQPIPLQVYLKDRAKHDATARDWVAKYAT